ncbi:MAG: SIR2 family protein, partial [Allosphingosinicella sp.]
MHDQRGAVAMRQGISGLTYVRRHYFDEEKLKQFAIAEFIRAIRTGRLIAFTGSYTTEPFGYPNWSRLLEDALSEAHKELSASQLEKKARGGYSKLIETILKVAERDARFDGRVAFSAVAQMLDHIRPHERLSQKVADRVAKFFWSAKLEADFNTSNNSITALFDDLLIDRVVTTNYDFELECHAMQIGARPRNGLRRPGEKIDKLVRSHRFFDRDGGVDDGYSLIRTLPNGERIVSDIVQRDRPESLIEFAIGCPENDKHIFHLHGRADHSAEMILSYRDYDRLYRRSGLGKAPFEHALRILFAGNPVLFVGLGMSEPEINATLAEFVGNHPYVRKAPAFLIWNTPVDWPELRKGGHSGSFYAGRGYPKIGRDERKAAFRLDKLHRLGVLTIFTDDLDSPGSAPTGLGWQQLHRSLHLLSQRAAEEQQKRLRPTPLDRWRDNFTRAQHGYDHGRLDTGLARWVESTSPTEIISFEPDHFMTVLIRPSRVGKTALVEEAIAKWQKLHTDGIAAAINFNMRLDTDSILSLIALLLRFDPEQSRQWNLSSGRSREKQFADPNWKGVPTKRPLLLVLKGIERIFDVNGHPLSAEFDQFLRIMASRAKEGLGIEFLVIGTDRIRGYFEGLRGGDPMSPAHINISKYEDPTAGVSYIDSLADRFQVTGVAALRRRNKESGDYASRRRAIYQGVLSERALLEKKCQDPALVLDIVEIMSFIGQPVEKAVLFHAPTIRERLKINNSQDNDRARRQLNRAFADLERLELIKEINFRNGKAEYERRYTVHLSLQSEIRDRNGIPLSDSILSTAYNMSLFSSQPADGALPEADLHDKLGQLIDWLIGAYKDDPFDRVASRSSEQPHVVAAFRAGFALVRGFSSISALLSVDRGDRLVAEDRDGLLTEHAQRLDRILAAFGLIVEARESKGSLGPEALYPDELVWLHNERGVVKLAQGDLYEARFSFDEAERINRYHVEYNDQSHNWRRISLNQIVVDIE